MTANKAAPRDLRLEITCPRGALLVGGHAAAQAGLAGAHAMDDRGRPIIPATALRGALRQSMETWLKGCSEVEGAEEICSHDPEKKACGLCLVCRLFGGDGEVTPEGARRFSALIIEDATLDGAFEPVWSLRHGNAIDRKTRSVSDDLLFTHRVAQLLPGARFSARVRLDSDPRPPEGTIADGKTRLSLHQALEGAAKATTHLGAGRTRGLGRVQMKLVDETRISSPVEPLKGGLRKDRLGLCIELVSQTCIAPAIARENVTETRPEVPGATLRGALGFALAERWAGTPQEEAMQSMLDPESGVIFDFAYPIEPGTTGLSAPRPLTALRCKGNREHAVWDGLLSRLMSRLAESDPSMAPPEPRCPTCGGAAKGASGARRRKDPLPQRALTRTAIDRRRDAILEHALFTQTLLLPKEADSAQTPVRFEGTLRNVTPRHVELLDGALEVPITVGRGRSRGWGKVKITAVEPPKLGALAERRAAFIEAARAARVPEEEAKRWLVFTALSPIVPEGEDCKPGFEDVPPSDTGPGGPGSDELVAAIEQEDLHGVEPFLAVRRFGIEGVWVQRAPTDQDHADRRMQVILAGSVFVLRLPKAAEADVLASALARVEARGIGRRRTQGFGALICFDPFITQQASSSSRGKK